MTKPLKIHKLEAQNIYKLKHVILEFGDKGLTKIGGANDQGKSSLFNAIRIAFDGKTAAESKPIREGEKSGLIKVDCGDFIISRSVNDSNISLKITTKDGKTYNSPQKFLNELKSNLSFKPDKFMNMDSKAQIETLKKLTGLNFDKLDESHKKIYEERTLLNREKKLHYEGVPLSNIEDESLPDEEILIYELIEKLNKTIKENDAKKQKKETYDKSCKERFELISKIEAYKQELKLLEKEIDSFSVEDNCLIATDILENKIKTAESTNQKIRDKIYRKKMKKELEQIENNSQKLTNELKEIRSEKARLVKNSNIPVNGLTLEEDGVYCDGIPFSQLSQSGKLRISILLGMALNPKLRLMLVEDASLFDDKNLRILSEMASEKDYQILAEIVTKSESEEKACEIILENGEVKK